VAAKDFEMASLMLEQSAPAVFRMHDTMCEAATHRHWAQSIMERARIYGITGRPRSVAKLVSFPDTRQRAVSKTAAGGVPKRRVLKTRQPALATA
jgi:hypothetical protein